MRRTLFTIGIAITLMIATSLVWSDNQALTPKQTKEVKQIVHDYLLQHPEILEKMAKKLRAKQQKADRAEARQAIQAHSQELFHHEDDPVLGNPDGTITLVEFMDYQCPHCKSMAKVVRKLIKANPNLRVVVKELPIYSQTSNYAAQAALAAASQNQFKAFHYALLEADEPLTKTKIHDIANKAGLDVEELKKHIEQGIEQETIKTNFRLAQALKLQGTPAFVVGINGKHAKYIPQATTYQRLQNAIDQLKAKQ